MFTFLSSWHTQMVGLYQDPEGKMIFARTNASQQLIATPSKLMSNQNTAGSPGRQAQELDNGVRLLHMLLISFLDFSI